MDSYNRSNLDTVRMDTIEWAGPAIRTSPARARLKPRSFVKRTLDLAGSAVLLALFLPLFLLIAVAIKASDPRGSVFFRQSRIGQHAHPFTIIKFRSMVHDAQDMLQRDARLYEKYVESGYKLDPREDPRITRIGGFLRRTSLDELPQLINVLRGEMSLVGPRPVVKEELREYGERTGDLLSVRPGLTGYWQICGRSNVGYPERARLELHYVDRQSLLFDIWILVKTVQVVLLRTGAY